MVLVDSIDPLFSSYRRAQVVATKMGKRIGQIEYDPNEQIGNRSCDIVFSGTFQGRRVAVKRVTMMDDIMKSVGNAFNSLMDHPNVVKLFHAEKDDDFQ